MDNNKRIRITAKLETSNHCGYCTGERCVYEVNTKNYYVKPPKDAEWISECDIGYKFKISDYNWESLLPRPDVFRGYWTCSCSEEVEKSGLQKHDYRYTIMSVKMSEKYWGDKPNNPSQISVCPPSIP